MATVIIKHRLFTWFEKTENPVIPGGDAVWMERLAHQGEEIEIPEDNPHLARGRQLDAFYEGEHAEAIRNGTYRGADAASIMTARQGLRATSPGIVIEDLDNEGPQTQGMSAEELGEYIKENRMNASSVIALVDENSSTDEINKVLDAENYASDNSPRKGVSDALDRYLALATEREAREEAGS